MTSTVREDLAHRIAGEITLSEDPGATLRKWRTDFDVSQTELAARLDVSSSVISDYESGRRESPGIGIVRRLVTALLDVDEDRGGSRIRQYGRVLSAGFENDIVYDLREYSTALPIEDLYEALDATEIVRGDRDYVNGHTVINSIQTITRLSNEYAGGSRRSGAGGEGEAGAGGSPAEDSMDDLIEELRATRKAMENVEAAIRETGDGREREPSEETTKLEWDSDEN